jgi:serpin B
MKTRLGLALVPAILFACSPEPDDAGHGVEVVRSSLARNTSPSVSETDRTQFAESQASFAVDLYQAVRKTPEHVNSDILLSPHSISTALAMTYAGARGETQSEMKSALHFDLPDDSLHPAFDWLDLALASRGQGAKGKDGQPFRLQVLNSIWGQKGAPFQQPFLDTLAVNYDAGLNVVDFVTQADAARAKINGWVEEKTEKRIKDLVPEKKLTADTRLVLVNAVYFNAGWLEKFAPEATAPAPFTKLDGSTVQVSMMRSNTTSRSYMKRDGFEAVAIPYEGSELAMLVIAPDKGSFPAFEAGLTGAKVLDVLAGLEPKEVILSFPKLKLEGSFELKQPLMDLGMKRAFGGEADFSGILATEPLAIEAVLHKTFMALDENGTEAAAATAVIAGRLSAPADPPVEMKVDRPFITAIVDGQTKTLVFLGRVLEPHD